MMATASNSSGDITMWDLNDGGRIVGVLRGAHEMIASDHGASGGINRIEFLPGQPVIVSTGLDNSLRTWILDETPFSPIPRALHSRSGHGAPVTTLNFLPASSDGTDSISKWLLSGGKDRSLWGFSLRKDGQSTEISQGNVQKRAKKMAGSLTASRNNTVEDLKAPEITYIACSLNRDGGMGAIGGGQVWANAKSKNAEESNITGWESVVTAHKGDKFARTWFWGKKKAGRWAFETGDAAEVKSVAVTSCGTFALLGSASGGIDMFNLQSGIHRQRFPSRLTPAQARKLRMQQISSGDIGLDGPRKFGLGEGKHTKAVTGVMADALNKIVISCGLDGKVKFWEFLSGQLQDQLDWHPMTAITALRHNSSSGLIALSCDDLSIRVVDIETKRLVRELWGCVGQINDFCFSNDGRWIIAASMDSTLRVWDLPTGHLIDAFRTKSTCIALAFSDTGEYLATSHADDMGINIWNNRSLFLHIPTRHISEDEVRDIAAPTVSGEGGSLAVDAAYDQNSEDKTILALGGVSSIEQLTQDMLTLSVVPKTRWQTLLHLDTIKQRNKPIEPPKAPEKAPFFLPSLLANGSKPSQQSDTDIAQIVPSAEKSRITTLARTTETQFTSLLRSSSNRSPLDFTAFISHMKSLSPSAADLEIRSLRLAEMPAFVDALTSRLGEKRDYELVNAWMAVFLRLHGEVVVGAASGKDAGDGMDDADENGRLLVNRLVEWRREQESEGKRLGELVGFTSAVVNWVRSERG
jgi:U3 small nucleolar RNA-associated protein 21